MHAFAYERPATLAQAIELLVAHRSGVSLLAGGTDLIIGLRDGSSRPELVIDVKRIPELCCGIRDDGDRVTLGATTVMTELAGSELIRTRFQALAEAAAVVGSVQIRNRATIAGNICNGSPAADTFPPLLVFGAVVIAAGPNGMRRIPIDDFPIKSRVTALAPGELVTAIELPVPAARTASVHTRRSRRRGHDLASVTLACAIDETGATRIAFGSVGPRPVLRVDSSGTLADPKASDAAKAEILETMFAEAAPSRNSMRASPEYRLAMLRVLGTRAVRAATERLASSDLSVADPAAGPAGGAAEK
jgi:CO/xanthine dehydrogenase FAD-binding subunit